MLNGCFRLGFSAHFQSGGVCTIRKSKKSIRDPRGKFSLLPPLPLGHQYRTQKPVPLTYSPVCCTIKGTQRRTGASLVMSRRLVITCSIVARMQSGVPLLCFLDFAPLHPGYATDEKSATYAANHEVFGILLETPGTREYSPCSSEVLLERPFQTVRSDAPHRSFASENQSIQT